MSRHGNFNSSVTNIATLSDLQSKVDKGIAADGVYMLNNGDLYAVSNGSSISAVGGGSDVSSGFGALGIEKAICDWKGNLHPSLWSKLVDATATFSIADPAEIPGSVSFDTGPVVKVVTSTGSAQVNLLSPTFTAKSFGVNGSITNIRIPIYFPEYKYNATSGGESITVELSTDTGLLNRISFYLTAAGNTTDTGGNTVNNDSLQGWHDLIVPISNTVATTQTNIAVHSVAGTPDIGSITKIRIQVKRYLAGDTNPIFIGPITYGIKSTPKIIFSFDDDDISIYNTAFPLMKDRGFVGTFFTKGSVQTNNGVTKVNLAQLKEMQSAGWTIANHTQNHFNHLTDVLTYQQRYDDINSHMQWLKDNGFDWDIFAWPGGAIHNVSKGILKDLGVKAAFNYMSPTVGRLINIPKTAYLGDRYFLSRTPLEGSTTQVITNSETYINHAIETGGTIVLSGHIVSSAATGTTNTNSTEFTTVLDKILERQRNGLAEVVSMRDWVDSGLYSTY